MPSKKMLAFITIRCILPLFKQFFTFRWFKEIPQYSSTLALTVTA